MNRVSLLLLAGATLSLAACAGQETNNMVSANDADVILDDAAAANQSTNETNDVEITNTGAADETAAPAAARPRRDPPAREKAGPPAPKEEPDPHAGHDMNNMSH